MIHKGLFKLCRDCEQRGHERIWLVNIMACRCIFLPLAHQ